jgi:hypothetical protein
MQPQMNRVSSQNKAMPNDRRNVVILPYFCDEEVDRYLKIADKLSTFLPPRVQCEFLLAASPRTSTSQRLVDAFSALGKTNAFQCPTQIFGYPEGPTAMFWDCMDFLSENYSNSSGFGLWLESDMAPTQPDWLDRLSFEWESESEKPIMMGCFVPNVYRKRLFKRPRLILDHHINGGACYAMDFARHMPESAREGCFDMVVYRHAHELGRAKRTRQIAFSTHQRIRRDLSDRTKVLVHGFQQDKNRFIDQCLAPLSQFEKATAPLNPFFERLESLKRTAKLRLTNGGTHRDTLDSVLLAQQKTDRAANIRSARFQKAA